MKKQSKKESAFLARMASHSLDFNSRICRFSPSRVTGAFALLSADGGMDGRGEVSACGRGERSAGRCVRLNRNDVVELLSNHVLAKMNTDEEAPLDSGKVIKVRQSGLRKFMTPCPI